MSKINNSQYGVGFPIDMPVMLTYFENNELVPVRPNYPDYDHLIDYVAMQMDYNDFQLYKTPVVLTLQGEFEDEEMNEIVPRPLQERFKKIPKIKQSRSTVSSSSTSSNSRAAAEDRREDIEEDGYEDVTDDEEEEDDDSPWEEMTVDELVQLQGIDDESNYTDLDEEDVTDDDEDEDEEDVTDDGDDDDDDEEGVTEEVENENNNDKEMKSKRQSKKDLGSFWNTSPIGKIDKKYDDMPDYTIYRPENPDVSDIPADAFVTDEDARGLRRAHRRADKIIEFATDVSLIASFHYKKKNFHLVKLLEPIFIIGKRIMDIKGYYFTLLDDEEGDKVRIQNIIIIFIYLFICHTNQYIMN